MLHHFYPCNICFIVRCYKISFCLLHQYFLFVSVVRCTCSLWILNLSFDLKVAGCGRSFFLLLQENVGVFHLKCCKVLYCCSWGFNLLLKNIICVAVNILFCFSSNHRLYGHKLDLRPPPPIFVARRLILRAYAGGCACLSASCSQPLASLPLRSSPSVAGQA